jgi:hypothetical protein
MTKYFLIVLEPGLRLDQIQKLTTEIVEINSSLLLKYRIVNGSFVIHFSTIFNQSYLNEFIGDVMTKCQYNYILCENTDKVSLNFLSNNKEEEKSIMEDFLCLETGNVIIETHQDPYDPMLEELLDYIETEEDEDDDYYDYLKPKFTERYSLDELLDKIGESGLDSLTEDEKNFLHKIK